MIKVLLQSQTFLRRCGITPFKVFCFEVLPFVFGETIKATSSTEMVVCSRVRPHTPTAPVWCPVAVIILVPTHVFIIVRHHHGNRMSVSLGMISCSAAARLSRLRALFSISTSWMLKFTF